MRSVTWTAAIVVVLAATMSAWAQRADENALTSAGDAFGTSVGAQTIGLYSPTNARGFNPTQAGNVRIEGLYFDQRTVTFNSALFAASQMRIGVAAQSYLFPSPTGIADYSLRKPQGETSLSIVATHGPLDASTLEFDAQASLLKDVLSASSSLLYLHDEDFLGGQKSHNTEFSLLLRYQPSDSIEILPFYGLLTGSERREIPYVFADGLQPVPQFEAILLPAQPWSSWAWRQTNAGVIAKGRFDRGWSMTAGAFRSEELEPRVFNDLLLGPSLDRTADHVLDVVPPQGMRSYSGEVRLSHLSVQGDHRRQVEFTVRARQVERHFGGDSVTDFGRVAIDPYVPLNEPAIVTSASNRDDTHQHGLGVSYSERWQGVGALNLGILKSTYERSISTPSQVSSPQRANPLLPTLSFTLELGPGLSLYGSYVRGLEDSANAPTRASNRGEPAPATASRQTDGGIHWVLSNNLDFVLGAFQVHKPYFNVDSNDVYRQEGRITNQGLELSATMTPLNGVKVIAGFVRNHPQVDFSVGPASSQVPVGPVPSTINLNGDFSLPSWHGWGGSVEWTRLSSRTETDDGRFELPPLSTLNVGLRWARRCLDHPCSVRLDVNNVTDASGLTISSQYIVLPQLRRNYTMTAAIDI